MIEEEAWPLSFNNKSHFIFLSSLIVFFTFDVEDLKKRYKNSETKKIANIFTIPIALILRAAVRRWCYEWVYTGGCLSKALIQLCWARSVKIPICHVACICLFGWQYFDLPEICQASLTSFSQKEPFGHKPLLVAPNLRDRRDACFRHARQCWDQRHSYFTHAAAWTPAKIKWPRQPQMNIVLWPSQDHSSQPVTVIELISDLAGMFIALPYL